MKNLNDYIIETKTSYFSKQEINKIINDINAKDGLFIKFVDDKVNKNLGWKAAYNDYFEQCLDDDRCLAEMGAYVTMVIGRVNFDMDNVRQLIEKNIL